MESININAQHEVNAVLNYLAENRGKKIILGQHTQTMAQEELKHIEDVTGKLPALCGFELLGYSPNFNADDCSEECISEYRAAQGTLKKAWEWAEKGGLITFTWHWFSPLGGHDKSFFTKNTDFNTARIFTCDAPEYYALLSDMDYMAGLLRPFCDEHIPILWRPFHENEGDWFWWGKAGAKTVRRLYRLMYERYTEHFGLNNLIWVFNSTLKDHYPGDRFADIITRDMYPPAHCHTACIREFESIRDIPSCDKLYAIGETGTLPDVREICEKNIPWSWYMTWSNEFIRSENFTTNEVLRQTYSYENAVTLERLPKLY